jgi:hypothetical protein
LSNSPYELDIVYKLQRGFRDSIIISTNQYLGFMIRRFPGQVAVPAALAAKIKSLVALHQRDPFSLTKIGAANRIFDHDIINLPAGSLLAIGSLVHSPAEPGFKGTIDKHPGDGEY